MIYKSIDIVTKQPDLQPTQYLLITSVLCSGQSPLKREACIRAEGRISDGSGKTVPQCLGSFVITVSLTSSTHCRMGGPALTCLAP